MQIFLNIIDGTDYFSIENCAQPKLTQIQAFDREMLSNYTFEIMASNDCNQCSSVPDQDNESNNGKSLLTFQVTIGDVNDNPPELPNGIVFASMIENDGPKDWVKIVTVSNCHINRSDFSIFNQFRQVTRIQTQDLPIH